MEQKKNASPYWLSDTWHYQFWKKEMKISIEWFRPDCFHVRGAQDWSLHLYPDPLFPVRLICGSLIVQKMSCDLRWTVQRNGLVLFDSERVWLCFLVWDCLVLGSSSSPTRPITAICLRPLSSAPASLKGQTAGLIVKKSGTPAAILPLKRACEVLFGDAWGLSEASFRA